MKKLILIILLAVLAQVGYAQIDSLDYFGQIPPGKKAVKFAPGIISLTNRLEGKITFSPDGNEVYFDVFTGTSNKVYYTKRINNVWTEQQEAPFSINHSTSWPVFSIDGERLYFDYWDTGASKIWIVKRTAEGWSEAQPLSTPINSDYSDECYSETIDSTIYISSNRPGGHGAYGDIWCIRHLADQSLAVENLGAIVNSAEWQYGPCISPDGSFIIFSKVNSSRGGYTDLYISFNKGNGNWTMPLNMNASGAEINIINQGSPALSPDGKYLFFSPHNQIGSGWIMDISWVSTSIIPDLRKISFAPKLKTEIPDMNLFTDTAFSYQIPDSTFFCEYGTESLEYSASLGDGSALPLWISFNPGNRMLAGTPSKADTITIKITATNIDTISTSATFVIAIKDGETVTDIDGNVYHTIGIDTQVWMLENLKTTRYRNGDSIGTTNPATLDYRNVSAPKYQWAYNGSENNADVYGRLYTWYAVNDIRNIAPTGWHVATQAEWTTLVNYLGGASVAGDKLKEAGTTHWEIPNSATNTSGFTALPAGSRYAEGFFMGIGEFVHFWTADEYSGDNSLAWRWLLNNSSIAEGNTSDKIDGWAVRCVKDVVSEVGDSKDQMHVPHEIRLNQNYPNPFNPTTTISFSLPKSSEVKLTVFNSLGSEVITLINGKKSAGYHEVTLDASSLASGIYFYSLETNNSKLQKKMVLLK